MITLLFSISISSSISLIYRQTGTITASLGVAGSDGKVTFYANGTVTSNWDEIAQFRGVSEGDVIRYAFAKPEPLRTEHEAFRDAVLGVEGAADRIVTMEQGLATVAVASAMLESAKKKESVNL